ncbi:MAG: molybdopterin oxidoreductase, partial [bacterium]|nr:molybdopterin oxidoreductase [bacterium]
GFLAEFSEGKSATEWLQSFCADLPALDYDEFKRTGMFIAADQSRVGLADFIADPQTHPLNTPSGRVEISSRAYAETGYSPIPDCRILRTTNEHPLRLVTPTAKFRIHSQNNNIPWFREREPQVLWMHPRDAAERGIEDEQVVCASSPQGKMHILARVTDDIMPGVVCLLQGIWPALDPDGVDTAGSVNVLTSTTPTLPSNGSRTHSVLVEVTRI